MTKRYKIFKTDNSFSFPRTLPKYSKMHINVSENVHLKLCSHGDVKTNNKL